jgi:hypothetical protein
MSDRLSIVLIGVIALLGMVALVMIDILTKRGCL